MIYHNDQNDTQGSKGQDEFVPRTYLPKWRASGKLLHNIASYTHIAHSKKERFILPTYRHAWQQSPDKGGIEQSICIMCHNRREMHFK